MESIIKALFNWALVVEQDGSIRVMADVFLSSALIIGLFFLYRYKMSPLFKQIEQALPAWVEQTSTFNELTKAHRETAKRLEHIVELMKDLDADQLRFHEDVRSFIKSHPDALEQLSSATVNQHNETQKEVRDWLDNIVDKTQNSSHQLATIQTELRNISALLVAASAARYNKPLN
ncbi:hypothetical protein HUZ36_14430 [Pseudoalteromonas sp. McH1-7]|uniref:Uncharacterized protein n=1 Tax=Pseudoalteromonas peptidolytica F12-50-A1 TaxID=1315280 RepID=A0A8I0MXQ5_9GAMM|nr:MULTISPECIES: hypothetical protein [Pseudoalteromonas]MBE0347825.1 hypothetical protein [Pseudoalteromonas peptidolytica F12-50-A1]MDW7551260.1 hypothetical protein [Pseudoalteromonas peptidolytica]NLR15267.1 hypothetical protein [Pseudoalteromonas peptidolytica]NUZ11982.1 hypothetical protein [Pseudoalteromonas sp. McH1-7]RRS09171.1 hypothetical protein EAG18_08605 [Pseudoalteromonas sp. J010]